MIPVSIVRFSPDAPCVLQATSGAWDRLMPLLRRDTPKNDTARADVVSMIRRDRSGPDAAQRVTVSPAMARWILDTAQVG